MSLRHHFVVRTAGRDLWRVLYGEGEQLHDLAVIRWTVDLLHPMLALQRIERNLNAGERAPRRTWSASLLSEFQWSLRHNGREVGEVTWSGHVRRAHEWMVRIVAGLNLDLGHAYPFPEPQPPRPRYVEPVMGDFNFATGEEIPEHERTAAA